MIKDLFNRNEYKVKSITVEGLRQNWDYEVITNTVFDPNMQEFNSIEEAIKVLGENAQLLVNEDMIGKKLAFRYEKNDNDNIKVDVAKKCGFGVLKVLRGNMKDKQYMFPLNDIDVGVELFAYGVLAHGYADKKIIKKFNGTDEEFNKYVQLVLGDALCKEVINKIKQGK